MNRLSLFIIVLAIISCSFVKERLAVKECKFSLESVRPYDFSFTSLKVDFNIKGENPNKVDAVLDKLTYTFYINNSDVFSGTTGKGVKIKAGKSETFKTTVTLEYKKLTEAIIEALKMKTASYRLKGKAYVSTIVGEISYPVEIKLH
ncbi:MAG TPA: hypothetical protein EYP58_00360 [bacterium (Candidatus Stahlbacteria)]|nr:hypothetical protein [Candidatus Stahlbacteria bacterium]